MKKTNEQFLKERNTRELLKKTRMQNLVHDDEYSSARETTIIFRALEKGGVLEEYRIPYAEVRAELETREHVPNKRESRGLRLKRIRAGK